MPVIVVDVEAVRSLADVLPADIYRRWLGRGRHNHAAGVRVEDVSYVAWFPTFGTVMTGDFDTGSSAATLRQGGYELEGSHRDFDLYERRENSDHRLVAVGDGAIVWRIGDGSESPLREPVETMLDARRGAIPRAHERHDGFAAVTDHIGLPTAGACPLLEEPPEPVRFSGFGTVVDGETAHREVVAAYPDSASIDRNAFRDWVSSLETRTTLVDMRIRTEGSLAVASERRPANDLGESERTAAEAEPEVTPMVTASCSITNGTVQLHHLAGDEIEIDQLRLYGESRQNLSGGTLGPGESLERQVVSSDDGVDVVYENGDRSMTLAECGSDGES